MPSSLAGVDIPAEDLEYDEPARRMIQLVGERAYESPAHAHQAREVAAAIRASESRDPAPDGEQRANIAYVPAPLEGIDRSREEVEAAVDACVNPPGDHLVSYSVAVVNSDNLPRRPFGTGHSGAPTKAYLDMTEMFAPAPRHADRPGVRMVFDLDRRTWNFSLQHHWKTPHDVVHTLRMSLDQVRVSAERADRAVCRAVAMFEKFMVRHRARLETPAFLKRYRLGHRIEAEIEEMRSIKEGFLADENPETELYPKVERLVDESLPILERAEKALAAGDVEAAERQTDRATETARQATSILDDLEKHESKAGYLERRVGQLRDQLGIRTAWWAPWGSELSNRLWICEDDAEQYREATANRESLERLDSHAKQARECLAEVDRRRDETSVPFWIIVYGLGALVIIVAFGGGGWMFRRYRITSGPLGVEVETALENWNRQLERAGERMATLREAHPNLFEDAAAGPDGVTAETLLTLNRACVLLERGRQIRDDARDLYEQAGPFDVDALHRARELLEEETTTVEPRETRGMTPVLDGLREPMTIDHVEWLDALVDALDRLESDLEEADGVEAGSGFAHQW